MRNVEETERTAAMSIFDRFKKPPKPNQMPRPQPIDGILEQSLFAEGNILLFLGEEGKLFEKGTREDKIRILEKNKDHPETRTRLLVWSELRKLGVGVPEELRKKVLGVVFEVGIGGGMDYLAAYEDHSARYYNFSGKVVIAEATQKELGDLMDRLLEAGHAAAMRLGLWESPRRRGVAQDMVRMTFLTPAGIYFGEGPMSAMMQDEIGQAVFSRGVELMTALAALGNQ